MAEKYSVLIKYKYLDYIENAKLSDADSWVFLKGVIKYDKEGTEPVFKNPVLTGLFAVVKLDLDQNRESYEKVFEKRSEAGKKGAEKRWCGKNDGKNGNSHPDMANDGKNGKTQKTRELMAKMHDLDSDHDLVSVSDIDSGEFTTACAVAPEKPHEKALIPKQPRSPPEPGTGLTPEELVLFRAAKACFESSEKSKALMYQDSRSAAREMKHLKTLVRRCGKMAPGITAGFLKTVLENFRGMCNGRFRGKTVFTPQNLITPWVWALVIDSLPEAGTEEDRELYEIARGIYK